MVRDDLMTDEDFLKRCRKISRKSDCKKIHFGSLLVRNNTIIGSGYNHTIEDGQHECLKDLHFDNYQLGSNPAVCLALHSEWDALLDALNVGRIVRGSTLYILGEYPSGKIRESDYFICTVCARLLRRAGVREVVSINENGEIQHQDIEEATRLAYKGFVEEGAEEI